METPDSSTISVEAVQQPGSETEFGQHLLSLTPFHPRKQILPSCAHVRYGDLQASGGPASPGINELRPPSDVLLQMDAAETQPLQLAPNERAGFGRRLQDSRGEEEEKQENIMQADDRSTFPDRDSPSPLLDERRARDGTAEEDSSKQ